MKVDENHYKPTHTPNIFAKSPYKKNRPVSPSESVKVTPHKSEVPIKMSPSLPNMQTPMRTPTKIGALGLRTPSTPYTVRHVWMTCHPGMCSELCDGFLFNNCDNSCGLDSFLAIMIAFFTEHSELRTMDFANSPYSDIMRFLNELFGSFLMTQNELNVLRNHFASKVIDQRVLLSGLLHSGEEFVRYFSHVNAPGSELTSLDDYPTFGNLDCSLFGVVVKHQWVCKECETGMVQFFYHSVIDCQYATDNKTLVIDCDQYIQPRHKRCDAHHEINSDSKIIRTGVMLVGFFSSLTPTNLSEPIVIGPITVHGKTYNPFGMMCINGGHTICPIICVKGHKYKYNDLKYDGYPKPLSMNEDDFPKVVNAHEDLYVFYC